MDTKFCNFFEGFSFCFVLEMKKTKTKVKAVFQYVGEEKDEVAFVGKRAPKKGERKKLARVGRVEEDLAPVASRDGLSRKERLVKKAKEAAKRGEALSRGRKTVGMTCGSVWKSVFVVACLCVVVLGRVSFVVVGMSVLWFSVEECVGRVFLLCVCVVVGRVFLLWFVFVVVSLEECFCSGLPLLWFPWSVFLLCGSGFVVVGRMFLLEECYCCDFFGRVFLGRVSFVVVERVFLLWLEDCLLYSGCVFVCTFCLCSPLMFFAPPFV